VNKENNGPCFQGHANVVMPQPYGYVTREGGAGSEGSVARIEEIRRRLASGKIDSNCLVIFPQGLPPTGKDRGSLGQNMAEYVSTLPEFFEATILHEAKSWGTANDIQAAYVMATKAGCDRDVTWHFATDANHLRRVKVIWLMTHPRGKGWQAKFYEAKGHVMSDKERFLREPIHCLKEVVTLMPIFICRLLGR